MIINFELYKVFYFVASSGSFSKASEVMLISQPAVSQSIKSLEEQLGIQLFVRTKKGIILTEEGRELFNYVKEGMNYFVNGYNKITSLKRLDSGVLRIGASSSVSEHYLMKYISLYHKLYPNIEIKIVNMLSSDLFKELRNGNVDIVFSSIIDVDKDLEFKEICKLHDVFVSKEKRKLSLKDLLEENIIIQSMPSVTRTGFNSFLDKNNLEFKPYMEVVSHRLVIELVKNNIGIGLVTKEYVNKELIDKELFIVDVDFSLESRTLGYLLPKNSIPSFRVKAFLELLKNTN